MMSLDLNIKTIFFVILFLFLFIIALLNRKKHFEDQKVLIYKNEISSGIITYFGGLGGRSAAPPEYSFYFGNTKIVSKFFDIDFCRKVPEYLKFEFTKYQFPVIYYPHNPEINKILLKIEDYDKYNIPIPDSLAEVLVYYFNCDYKVVRPESKPAQIIKKKSHLSKIILAHTNIVRKWGNLVRKRGDFKIKPTWLKI